VLKKLPGVEDVKMDAAANTAQVSFDPTKVSPEQLAKAAQNRQKLNQLREEMRTVLGGADTQ